MQRTLSIIKPDATKRNLTDIINKIIENNGLRIIAQKRLKAFPSATACMTCKKKFL